LVTRASSAASWACCDRDEEKGRERARGNSDVLQSVLISECGVSLCSSNVMILYRFLSTPPP